MKLDFEISEEQALAFATELYYTTNLVADIKANFAQSMKVNSTFMGDKTEFYIPPLKWQPSFLKCLSAIGEATGIDYSEVIKKISEPINVNDFEKLFNEGNDCNDGEAIKVSGKQTGCNA